MELEKRTNNDIGKEVEGAWEKIDIYSGAITILEALIPENAIKEMKEVVKKNYSISFEHLWERECLTLMDKEEIKANEEISDMIKFLNFMKKRDPNQRPDIDRLQDSWTQLVRNI